MKRASILVLAALVFAIPVSRFREANGKFILDGATKQALLQMPAFEYAR